MPKLVGSLVKVELGKRTAFFLNSRFQNLLVEATKIWLGVMREEIPIWSGMSQSALKPIADAVDVPLFIRPVSGAPDRTAEGEAAGAGSGLETSRGVYELVFNSAVPHFAVNEFTDATKFGFRLKRPGPYHSQEKAADAFFDYIDSQRGFILNIITSNLTYKREIFK